MDYGDELDGNEVYGDEVVMRVEVYGEDERE